jgi:hypothetical protein
LKINSKIRRLQTPAIIFLLLATALHAALLSANEQQPETIGYIDDSRFHPLVVATSGTISRADSAKMELKGKLRNAFRVAPETYFIQKVEDYVDAHGEDTPGRFGVINKKTSSIRDFYTLHPSGYPSQSPDVNKEIIRNFYTFFSHHKWGQHFFEGKKLLDKPIEEIAKKTNLRVHVVTDLNHNSRPELWISYKLMYGEIGRMVYEQAGDGSNWGEIANHCYLCD